MRPTTSSVASFALLLAAFATVTLVRFWHIGAMPEGLFVDETAIGYNAALIGETGYSEDGSYLPLFTNSVGDYRGPVMIYTVVLLFKLFGVSIPLLRGISALFHTIALLAMLLTVRKMFSRHPAVSLYMIVAGTLLPWLFVLSRITFEVNSYPPLAALTLLSAAAMWEHGRTKNIPMALLTGFFLASTLYAYGTSRVLAFLLLGALLMILAFRRQWMNACAALGIFAVTAIPYLIYASRHPDALLVRFKAITYIYDPALTLMAKVKMFFVNYATHFSGNFLVTNGDANWRHATGYGGQLYLTVLILGILGALIFLFFAHFRRQPFMQFLFAGLVFAPVGSALTMDTIPHSFRSILLPLYILLFSAFGCSILAKIPRKKLRLCAITAVFAGLTLQAVPFVRDYFSPRYIAITHWEFETYGLEEALQQAEQMQPSSVVVSPSIGNTTIEFYRRVVGFPAVFRRDSPPQPDTCYIFPASQAGQYGNPLPPVEIGLADGFVVGRCFR